MTASSSFVDSPAAWTGGRGNREFRFRHSLDTEPLFQLEALAELADRMDPHMIETADALSDTVVETRETERLDAGPSVKPGDVVRQLEADGRWMSMRHVETDRTYGALVERLFAEFTSHLGDEADHVYGPEGYVFIGASNAVTPAHVDHEHNLFFHVRGAKTFTTGKFPDDDLAHRTFEGMYGEEYGSTAFSPTDQQAHHLNAGDGLYVPPTALHFVENSGSLAISFSLVFHDRVLDRTARVYAANGRLRNRGLSPRPPGRSLLLDRAKAGAVDGWRASTGVRQRISALRRDQPTPG